MYSAVKLLSLATLFIVVTNVALYQKEWEKHSNGSKTYTASDTTSTGGLSIDGNLAAFLTPSGLIIAAIITVVVYKGKKHAMTYVADQDLGFITRTVRDVLDKWEGILMVKTIDRIRRYYRGAERQMIAFLSPWLKRQTIEGKAPNPLWKSVVQVVDDCVGAENPAHALNILQKNRELESLLTRTKQLSFSSTSSKYCSKDDDFKLTVPEGAVPTGDSISVQVGVVPYGPVGPFKYPDGVRPVSPIVWLCSTPPKFEFQKPIEVSLPHCIDCTDEDDYRNLIFLKADHSANQENPANQDSTPFHFELADGKASLNESYGVLHTSHFCYFCLAEYTREDTDKAKYCLHVARPLQMEKISKVYFCLTYDLPTCLKLMEEQFDERYTLSRKSLRLAERPDRALGITVKMNDSEANGWHVALSQKKITAREVCFWDAFATSVELKHACEQRLYPPRFILEIHGENGSSDSRIEVEFDGATSQLSTEILLSLDISTTVSAPVPTVQSQTHLLSSLLSDQKPSMHQTPPTQQQQNPTPSQIQQPLVAGETNSTDAGSGFMSTDVSTTVRSPVPTVQSQTQSSSSLPSGQQPSMYQIPPTQQRQHPQMATPNQVQQPPELVMVAEEFLTFSTNEECTFDHREGQGFVLNVTKGAVLSGNCTVKVKSYVVSQSKSGFIFPNGSKLVTGMYHIAASRKLSKPVSLRIEHCAIVKSDTKLEVAIADSRTGPPYHFRPYTGGNVHVIGSYIEVELKGFCWVCGLLRLLHVIREPASICYCCLVCCLRSEFKYTWEYYIVVIRNLQLCIAAVKKEYATAESRKELNLEFEKEGGALILNNVSVEETTTTEGWHVATVWDPPRIEQEEADNFEPGRVIPQCCVLASYAREATTVGVLSYVLKFSGTRKPKSYRLYRKAQCEQSTGVSSVDETARSSIPTPDYLTAQDLYDLTSILKAAAPKWKTIGGALGFADTDLTIIQSKPLLMQEGVTGYFREMLGQWLKWAPPNHHWPTITALERAVRGSGHESLANNFRVQFQKKKDVSTTGSAPVLTEQSQTQPSSLLPSGQQLSTYWTPPTQQQQNPQMATPNQVQQPPGTALPQNKQSLRRRICFAVVGIAIFIALLTVLNNLTSGSEQAPESSGIIRKGDRPTLHNLKRFLNKSGKAINIPLQIGTSYRTLGICLLKDDCGMIISDIENTKVQDTKKINEAILQQWISGKCQQPCTWETLMKCLREAELNVLASDVEEVLQ